MRESECLVREKGLSAAGTTDRHGPAMDGDIRFKTFRGRWLMFMKLVHEQFPYCTMYEANIADGVIVSCGDMQEWFISDKTPARKPDFDPNWQALETYCRDQGCGRITELKFHDGRPVVVKITLPGRRFPSSNRKDRK
jgi:hypothetical protein